jgi:hypothetical protein
VWLPNGSDSKLRAYQFGRPTGKRAIKAPAERNRVASWGPQKARQVAPCTSSSQPGPQAVKDQQINTWLVRIILQVAKSQLGSGRGIFTFPHLQLPGEWRGWMLLLCTSSLRSFVSR